MNIIGAGHVGKVFGRLFARHAVFEIQDVLNRSSDSARRAVEFIGAGNAVSAYAELRMADITMLSVPDDRIAACCLALESLGHLRAGAILFHCSGAMPSSILAPEGTATPAIASVHPVRSFADPAQVAASFPGTFCSLEGSAQAIAVLQAAFDRIGARTIEIGANNKTLYHAAAVFASNYLVSLMDISQRAYVAAGIPPELAGELAAPLVMETMGNIFRLGPAAALTGPIARGDMATVARQQEAVSKWDAQAGQVYKAMTDATLDLASRKIP